MNNIKYSYDIILSALKQGLGDDYKQFGLGIRPGPRPRFSDLEIIALALTAEYLSEDSEHSLFRQLKHCERDFPNLISRRQYNDRRKALSIYFEECWDILTNLLPVNENVFVIDSTPARICRFARRKWNKMGKKVGEIKPAIGFCAAQAKERYFGYKLHAICTPEGIIRDYYLTSASNKIGWGNDRDILYDKDIRLKYKNCTIVGDKGYINDDLKAILHDIYKVDLQYPPKINSKNIPDLPKELTYKRKRVETVFSQLANQFSLTKNLAKSFTGFKTRLHSKLCSYAVTQYINMLSNQPLGKLQDSFTNLIKQ